MNTQEQLVEEFKAISIRGRMASGIHCLEQVLKHLNCNESLIYSTVLPRMYELVESNQKLNIWDNRMTEVSPWAVLDKRLVNDFSEYETIDEDDV